MNYKCHLSIDFEDFCYDYRKMHGIKFDEKINKKSINESYEIIKFFCLNTLSSSKITFFCTGILAEKYPEIIKKISDDGHEIACHYYYHNYCNKDNIQDFESNLKKAKYYLNKASGQLIKGFRAPFFSINKDNIEYLKVLSKHFDYDSSLHFNSSTELNQYVKDNSIKNLKLHPVFNKNYMNLFNRKIGGTYMKILNSDSLLSLIKSSIDNKIIPIIYLHPYEFMPDKTFFLNYNKINSLGIFKKIFVYFNQFRWHYLNQGIINKLSIIFNNYDSAGKMCDINYNEFFNNNPFKT